MGMTPDTDRCHRSRAESCQRPLVTGRTSSASSYTSRALRQTDQRAKWQVSWGFRGKAVDCQGAEIHENRSPEAISLRT